MRASGSDSNLDDEPEPCPSMGEGHHGADAQTGLLARGVMVGALAGLLFGFDTAVIAGTTSGLRSAFHLTATDTGITVSAALWGTLLGALMAGRPGDQYGAHACLKGVALLYFASSLGCFAAWNWSALLAFRAIAGLAVGGSSVLAPVYLAEITPPHRRGAMVGAFQLNVVIGILVAYLSNASISSLGLGEAEWRWKFAVTGAPALLLFTLIFTIPQSPRWLVAKGRLNDAREALCRLGSRAPGEDLAAIAAQAEIDKQEARQRLSWRFHRRPIILAVAIAGFNQLSGINAILYYLNDIFMAAGFSSVSADKQAVAIGATNLLLTVLALAVIDRIGRKTLLMIGSVGLAATLSAAGAIFLSGRHQELLLPILIGFIASFAFSQGAVIWVYISEIFPTAVRARGQSLGSSTHWFMDAIIAAAFPVVAATSRGAPFLVFALMMAVQFVVVWVAFPETKGLALEEIKVDARLARPLAK